MKKKAKIVVGAFGEQYIQIMDSNCVASTLLADDASLRLIAAEIKRHLQRDDRSFQRWKQGAEAENE